MEAQFQHDIIPRTTVESIVRLRDMALEECIKAHLSLESANLAIENAQKSISVAAPDQISSYTFGSHQSRENFLSPIDIAPIDEFTDSARRMIDISVWSHVIQMTELESFMDHEAKDELRSDLQKDPPVITVENIFATLQRFREDSDTIWRRGLANCFTKLDRRFRSHDGWKIGSRVILTHMFDKHGFSNYYRNQEDTLHDIERVFFILDGRPAPTSWYGITQKVRNERAGRSSAHQSCVESEFFRVRCFKNGNAHIWFQRDDLVERANKVLAEYYGEVLSHDEQSKEDPLTPKYSPAKYHGHFPTPDKVAQQVISSAALYKHEEKLSVLEPSAGGGNIARLAVFDYTDVDCIELQGHLAYSLKSSGKYRNVWNGDFLARIPSAEYDRVVMNPPFDRERDIDHVLHALEFLKAPNGILVAIMSAGTEWRETSKSRAFRDQMASMNAKWLDLPAGSFSSVGTCCNTVLLRVWKDGRKQSHWW